VVVGASGRGVIGGLSEVQSPEGVSIAAACLPEGCLEPFVVEVPKVGESPRVPQLVGEIAQPSGVMLLSNPYYVDGEQLLDGVQAGWPSIPVFGGLASGGEQATEHALFCDGELVDAAAVGVVFGEPLRFDTCVSPGCRAIGDPFIITRHRDGLIQEFDRGRPLDALMDLHDTLSARDRSLFGESLCVGLEVDAKSEAREVEDYLIRNIVGVNDEERGIQVAAHLQDYQVARFFVRDAVTSAEDLRKRLEALATQVDLNQASALLLFTCVGRGVALYGREGHDSDMLREKLGDFPVAGLFCNGEFGDLGGRTYLHGYTSVVVVVSVGQNSDQPV